MTLSPSRADSSGNPAMKKFKLDRIISIATLAASLVPIRLGLKKPAPLARPQAPAAVAANAQSFDQKMAQLEQASQSQAGHWRRRPREPVAALPALASSG